MSAFLTLMWLPGSLVDKAQSALSQLLTQWASDWGAPEASRVAARILSAGMAPTEGRSPWSTWPATWHDALARALLSAAGPTSAVTSKAVRQATDALQTSLRQRFQVAPGTRPWPALPMGHTGLELSFDWLGESFVITLDAEELRAGGWLLPQPTQPLPTVALELALADRPVHLTAQLGTVAISATEVMQLQSGDVLLLEQTLDTPIQVISVGSALQLNAYLGATTSTLGSVQRAVRWLAP